jgi:hypothetical protein
MSNDESMVMSPLCWQCNAELIWGGDHDDDHSDYLIVTNYSCPNCKAFYLMYWGEPAKTTH